MAKKVIRRCDTMKQSAILHPYGDGHACEHSADILGDKERTFW